MENVIFLCSVSTLVVPENLVCEETLKQNKGTKSKIIYLDKWAILILTSVLPSYRNQSIDLNCKSIFWYLYDNRIDLKWVKTLPSTMLKFWGQCEGNFQTMKF